MTSPAICEVPALIDKPTLISLGRLAYEVERLLVDFEQRLAGPCTESLQSAQRALLVLDAGADDAFELAWRASGAQRLAGALYVLSQSAGVAGLDVDAEWWANERAVLRLVDGGVR